MLVKDQHADTLRIPGSTLIGTG